MTGEPLTFEHNGETFWLDHLGDERDEDYGAYVVMHGESEIGEIWSYVYGCSPLVARVPLPAAAVLIRLAKDTIDEEH